ncbi:DUF3696 domain-containing protein [uncultured Thiodictyon sp.]|uniref:DUF3696 domain-containing protein n=1 Tax=uncultured Thiodictyon sp. TaxID=1846217 RepID=UPI0025DE6859|nr:DUF3696 domain-containing protein [uncultured Thiodictyon sp.]
MIIKALTLENFKGIREPVRIEFAPLTLLFGPNNAGKSTIVQALMYAREVLERNNCDAGRTELGGDVVDLGGFKNLVHEHDYRYRAIRMRFELDLSLIGLPDYTEVIRENYIDSTVHQKDAPTLGTSEIAQALKEKAIWVEFEIAWSEAEQLPYVRRYATGSGSETYADLGFDCATREVSIRWLNGGVPPFGSRTVRDVRESKSRAQSNANGISADSAPQATRRDVIFECEGWLILLFRSLVQADMIPVGQHICETEFVGNSDMAQRIPSDFHPEEYGGTAPGPLPLVAPSAATLGALPVWGKRLQVNAFAEDDVIDDPPYRWEFTYFAQEYLCDVLTTLITGPGERLMEALRQSVYVSAFREVPTRQYTPMHSPGANRWANGLAAWDHLVFSSSTTLKQANDWLGEGRLHTGYRIEVPVYREVASDSAIMSVLKKEYPPSTPEWERLRVDVTGLLERTRLQIRNLQTDTLLAPSDLGVGISQALPVIVAALHHKEGVVAIEEPESNIHPAFQVVLADLFITQAKANPNVLFLIETHSEHLMLRCLRRIRETAKGVLPEGIPAVTPEDIAVHFVESTDSRPRIRRIEIDEDGDFIDEWPGGFFEESYREKFAGR